MLECSWYKRNCDVGRGAFTFGSNTYNLDGSIRKHAEGSPTCILWQFTCLVECKICKCDRGISHIACVNISALEPKDHKEYACSRKNNHLNFSAKLKLFQN